MEFSNEQFSNYLNEAKEQLLVCLDEEYFFATYMTEDEIIFMCDTLNEGGLKAGKARDYMDMLDNVVGKDMDQLTSDGKILFGSSYYGILKKLNERDKSDDKIKSNMPKKLPPFRILPVIDNRSKAEKIEDERKDLRRNQSR
jgi:hypothetical protein